MIFRISTHALHAESDVAIAAVPIAAVAFLPTLSKRRATQAAPKMIDAAVISTHALHAESDFIRVIRSPKGCIFLPTLSMRRATFMSGQDLYLELHFYPRSPCGERQLIFGDRVFLYVFLPTLSMRRATINIAWYFGTTEISTHALHAESDILPLPMSKKRTIFLPTLSMRRATTSGFAKRNGSAISTHALHAESD